jgi:hypothetical protein
VSTETLTVPAAELRAALERHQLHLETFCREVSEVHGIPLDDVRHAVFTDEYLAVHPTHARADR